MQTTFTTVTGAISTTYRVELGSRGPQGIQGPPNILSIGTVTTGAPGSSASASISGTSPSQTLDLEIPRGDVGPPGPTDYNLLTNVPATFPPSAHTHVVSNITPVSGTHLIGRHAGGSGDAQEVTVGNGVEFSGSGIRRSALTGDVTASAGSNATTIANDAVTTAKIINDAVTNGKLANMATATIKGRTTAGTGDPEDLTAAQARTVIGVSPALVVSDTAPTSPVDGQQWLRLTTEILSIYSTSKTKWIIPYARGIDPDAEAWIDAVIAAGGTLFESETITKRKASDYFSALRTDATADLFALVGRMYFPVWDVAAANAICAKSRTSGTFNGTVTHTPGYVAGNGTDGYFDPGAGGGLGALGLTNADLHFQVGVHTAGSAGAVIIGSQTADTTNDRCQITNEVSPTSLNRFACPSAEVFNTATDASADRNGIIVGCSTATNNRFILRRLSTGVTSATNTNNATNPIPTAQPYIMARRMNDGTASLFYNGQIFMAAYGSKMTVAQATAKTLIDKQFYESLTGISIP